MAHSWDSGSRPLRVLAAGAFALAALDSHALALGDAEVRSVLGENLDLRIPVTIAKGESIEPSCFKLATEPPASVPRVASGRVSLERSLRGTYLLVRTDTAMVDPALVLGIVASCSGESAQARRDYSFLLNPRAAAAAPRAVAGTGAESQEAPWMLPTIATLIARIGDTLESIANAIFPANRAAKESYIQALRDTNPPLAALHERDPIPVDTPVALPDLRTFARARPHAATRVAAAPIEPAAAAKPATESPAPPALETPAPARKSRVARPARPAAEAPPRPVSEPAAKARDVAPAAKRPASVRAPGFMLKLSSGEMDLSPSKSVNDRMRAQLRERQLLLDADDQVAAVLSLRHSVRQLESRVAELQLKLAGMPSSFPAPKTPEAVAPAPSATQARAPAPSIPVAPSPPQPAASAPAPVVSTPAPAVSTPAPVVSAPAPPAPAPAPPAAVATPPPAAATPPEPAASAPAVATPPPETQVAATAKPPEKVEPPPVPAPAPVKAAQPEPEIDWLYYGLWALAFLLVATAILLAVRLAKRNREAAYDYGDDETTPAEAPTETPAEALDEALAEDEIVVAFEPPPGDEEFASEPPPQQPQRMLDADVDIATRLPDNNADDLRRRYIEERFPEIQKGAISLADPDSVVKGARLFYEDGAIARAVELLHFAIERHPEQVKAWLALFEIFRLEGLKGEFVELARRFREGHGKSDYWRKIQYFGREIDPGNELYAEKPLNTFETIGPAQARRLSEASFDPVAENWLGAPMDFQNEVLANELRMALMAGAGIGESDLVPNPMPALRNVEMFNVA